MICQFLLGAHHQRRPTGFCAREILTRHLFVDQDDVAVARLEHAARDQRNAEHVEVAGRHALRADHAVRDSSSPGNLKFGAVHRVAERHERGQADRAQVCRLRAAPDSSCVDERVPPRRCRRPAAAESAPRRSHRQSRSPDRDAAAYCTPRISRPPVTSRMTLSASCTASSTPRSPVPAPVRSARSRPGWIAAAARPTPRSSDVRRHV